MANLTLSEVALNTYWAFKAHHGSPPSVRKLATFLAIAKAENPSLDPDAIHRNNNGTIDVGIYQINSIHFGDNSIFTEINMHDPLMNATAAVMIEADSGFRAWTTYRVGAYSIHMPEALVIAREQINSPGRAPNETTKKNCPPNRWNPNKSNEFPNGFCCPEGTVYDSKLKSCKQTEGGGIPGTGLLNGLDAIGHFFAWLTQRESWYRIFFVTIGIVLFGFALYRLAGELNVRPPTLMRYVPKGKK